MTRDVRGMLYVQHLGKLKTREDNGYRTPRLYDNNRTRDTRY